MPKIGVIGSMSDEDFRNVVANSTNVCDVLRNLGLSASSGSMQQIVKKRIIDDNIDISHFKNHYTGGQPKYSLEDILVQNSNYSNIACLKRRLLKSNLLEYKCAVCGNIGEWNGKKLVLQLEHKNGIHNDHRLENLCFLCPNCHSQTSTYAGRNRSKYTEWGIYKDSNTE